MPREPDVSSIAKENNRPLPVTKEALHRDGDDKRKHFVTANKEYWIFLSAVLLKCSTLGGNSLSLLLPASFGPSVIIEEKSTFLVFGTQEPAQPKGRHSLPPLGSTAFFRQAQL